jgi:TPR repeat protein
VLRRKSPRRVALVVPENLIRADSRNEAEFVAQDDAKAREWLEEAAAKNNAGAMFNLGLLYHNGQGVAQDDAKAREWLEKAAAKGDAEAKTALEKLPSR